METTNEIPNTELEKGSIARNSYRTLVAQNDNTVSIARDEFISAPFCKSRIAEEKDTFLLIQLLLGASESTELNQEASCLESLAAWSQHAANLACCRAC